MNLGTRIFHAGFSVLVILFAVSVAQGFEGGGAEESSVTELRVWRSSNGLVLVQGRFVSQAAGLIRIEDSAGRQFLLRTSQLSSADQRWLRGEEPVSASTTNLAGVNLSAPAEKGVAAAFQPFEKLGKIKTHAEGGYFFVESNGLPSHQMMVGIKTWQQQVPLPQKYTGSNAWRIALEPKPAAKPVSTNGRFLRGAIALAVNGIPIFNPLNNRGADSYAIGELDEFGGHCGRADDYHYHLAPVHLEETVGKGKPIAYALDGYPIYGYTEPDGSPVKDLDECHGHADAAGNYHYHASKKYPYLNGGFHGVVTEKEGQVDPQPRAEPVRPDTRPLPGAEITGYEKTGENRFLLTYQQKGKTGTVGYQINADGSVTFEFMDPEGQKTTETYTGRPRRGGPEGQGPPRGGRRNPGGEDQPPPGNQPGARGGPERPPQGNRPPPGDQPPPPPGSRPRGGGNPRGGNGGEWSAGGGAGAAVEPSPRRLAGIEVEVGSDSIDQAGFLNIDCTCDGKRQSPEIHWGDLPPGTKSIAVSIWHTAPDQEKSYWVVYNIPAEAKKLALDSKQVGEIGLNGKRQAGYDPPCSQGPGVKVYHISVFAISRKLELAPREMSREKLLESIADCTLGEGMLDCKVERKAQQ